MTRLLPQNYRKITAKGLGYFNKYSKRYLKVALAVEILLAVVLISFCVFLFVGYKNAQRDRVEELKKLVFWEKQTVKFSNYPEAYYNASVHAARLGDNDKAIEYLDKSLQINPDHEPSKKLRGKITL